MILFWPPPPLPWCPPPAKHPEIDIAARITSTSLLRLRVGSLFCLLQICRATRTNSERLLLSHSGIRARSNSASAQCFVTQNVATEEEAVRLSGTEGEKSWKVSAK